MGFQGRKFRALMHRNCAVQPRLTPAFRHVVRCALLALSAACGAHEVSVPTLDPTTPFIPASIVRPEGERYDGKEGPYPAVVMLHDCSGLGPMSSGAARRWARDLAGKGYVVILPDSFTPRGHAGGICSVPPMQRHPGVVPDSRAADARAALTYLRTLSYVDRRRVGVMGGSHGGASTLATMASSGTQSFRAGLALYPACAVNYGSWRADMTGVYAPSGPVAILIGELDDWTPAEKCQRLVESARGSPHPVSIKVYPGAHHSFDSPNAVRYVATRVNQHAPGRRGATTGGNSAAWADSVAEVTRFFADHLAMQK